MENYYKVLNVAENASDDDIKRSYRILARKYHPDVATADPSAADKFRLVNEAHAVLSDPAKRKEYDAKLKESAQPSAAQQAAAQQQQQQQQRTAMSDDVIQKRATAISQNAASTAARLFPTADTSITIRIARTMQQATLNPIYQLAIDAKNWAYKTGYDKATDEAKRSYEMKIGSLKRENERLLKEQQQRLTQQLADQKSANDRLINEFRQDIARLQNKVNDSELLINELNDKQLDLKTEILKKAETVNEQAKTIEETAAKLDAKTNELEELNRKLEETVQAYEDQLSIRQLERDTLEKTLTEQINALTARLDDSSRELRDTNLRLNRANSMLQEVQQSLRKRGR